MGVGGEIDNRVNSVLLHDSFHFRCVTDVAVHETIERVVLDVEQIVHIAGIGQLIVDDDTIVGVFVQHVANEVGADEPGPAGDE